MYLILHIIFYMISYDDILKDYQTPMILTMITSKRCSSVGEGIGDSVAELARSWRQHATFGNGQLIAAAHMIQ